MFFWLSVYIYCIGDNAEMKWEIKIEKKWEISNAEEEQEQEQEEEEEGG